jgi:hypothetical protein
MKSKICFTLLLMLLSGCASTYVDTGLNDLLGKNIRTAFNVIGYPDSQQKFGSDTVYIWGHSSSSTLYVPQVNTTTGFVGGNSFAANTYSNSAVPINANAKIKIIADYTGTISSYEWQGNQYGLAVYSRRLKEYSDSLK